MKKDQRPDEIAADAAKASERGDHHEAERLYLTAAARASAYSNSPSMQKNVTKWDRCAARERRLTELTDGLPELNDSEKAMLANNQIIGAIKSIRARLGVRLTDAKDAVDTYRATKGAAS